MFMMFTTFDLVMFLFVWIVPSFLGGMAAISNDDSMRSDPFCLFHKQSILAFLMNQCNTLQ